MGKLYFIILMLLVGSLFGFAIKWTYIEALIYDRLVFGASPAVWDLGDDVNSMGGEPNQCLEIVTGSDEYMNYYPELGDNAYGIWRCIDATGALEWARNTETDEARSSVAIWDFHNAGDGIYEIIGGTTSGWNIEAMDRHGAWLWTFPYPPLTSGSYLWHSSPALADVVPLVPGLEVVIGNNPCNSVWCLQADPRDGINHGIFYSVISDIDCFSGYLGMPTGTDGIDWDVVWKYDTYGPVVSTPALGDVDADGDIDVVVGDGFRYTYGGWVPTPGGRIYCIDGPTGTLNWMIVTGGDSVVSASPALADFDRDGDLEIVVGAADDYLYLINGDEDFDGTVEPSEMARVPMGEEIHSSALIADLNSDGILEIVAATIAGDVMCLTYAPPTTYSTIWTTRLDTAIISSPAIGNPADPLCWTHFCGNVKRDNYYPISAREIDVFVCTMGGKVYRLEGSSGAVIDEIDLGRHIHASPVVADIDLDCELELVVTVCNDPDFDTEPDVIYCLGTGMFDPDCRECAQCVSRSICPVDTVLPIVSCPSQMATFAYVETTNWDRVVPQYTYFGVNVFRNDGSELHFMLHCGVNELTDFTVIPRDTVIASAWFNWLHNDSVIISLDSAVTRGGCKSYFYDTISFLVDLDPPKVFPGPDMPQIGVRLRDGHLEYVATDEPAGVKMGVSSLSVFVYHFDGTHSYYFLPGTLEGDIEINENDSVVVAVNVCDSIWDYGCSCGPNCTTYVFWYPVWGVGPVAEPVHPPQDIISACRDQEIWFAIRDSQGVDSTTIVAIFNGDTFTCLEDELSFSNDTLFFVPTSGYWADVETVLVELIAADDLYGNTLQHRVSWSFFFDFSPPTASMISPGDSSFSWDRQVPIELEFTDNFSGISVGNSTIRIEDRTYLLSELLTQISADSLYAAILFSPASYGLFWLPGDTIDIVANLCDMPDTCGPNCAEYRFVFYIPPTYGCARMPNPFTPNDDGRNDFAQFTYPGIGFEKGTISIYDIRNVPIISIDVPTGSVAKQAARWYGVDKEGRRLPQGVYPYVIEVNGEIVCEGTVTIAR